jgi:hypothetical protein
MKIFPTFIFNVYYKTPRSDGSVHVLASSADVAIVNFHAIMKRKKKKNYDISHVNRLMECDVVFDGDMIVL